MPKDLGNIEPVDLREVWTTEPEFTRWLAEPEHLAALGEELGLDLSCVQTEASVGDFSVDLLCEEAGTGTKAIIENQLETTNHDHLGKLVTYASGHGAGYIIWIFKDVREEHRQAIDWLNEHTTDDANFFAVKLELWRIGGSKPAPKFDVVCRPNEWAKTVKHQGEQREPSENQLRQLEFWSRLRTYAEEKKVGIRFQAPRPQHWTNVSIGSARAHVSLTMSKPEQRVGCELYIPDDKALFGYLRQHADELEKELGAKLEWIEAAKATRILTTIMGFDITDEEKYPVHFDWLLERASSFKRVFAEWIRTYNQSL